MMLRAILLIMIALSWMSCGVKDNPLPPLPVTPQQYELIRPLPQASPSVIPKAGLSSK